jgi:hypothetical protein
MRLGRGCERYERLGGVQADQGQDKDAALLTFQDQVDVCQEVSPEPDRNRSSPQESALERDAYTCDRIPEVDSGWGSSPERG